MPEYQIEMLWRCPAEGHVNKGRHKECQKCGRPKTEEDGFFMPDDDSPAAAVTDQEQLRHAKAGADWKCKFCGSMRRKLDGTCEQCGADQDMSTKGKSISGTGAEVKAQLAGDPFPPTGGYGKPGRVTPVPKSAPKEEERPRFQVPTPPERRNWGPFLLLLGFLSMCVGGYGIFIRQRDVVGVVSAVTWRHTIHVDRWKVFHREGFTPEAGSFNVQNLGKRYHHSDHVLDHYDTEHYSERVRCGEDCTPEIAPTCVDVPRTCVTVPPTCTTTPRNCTSNKNGYASCTGGDRVCSGGGQQCSGGGRQCSGGRPRSCTPRYCDEPRTRQVPRYRDDPVYYDFFGWDVWGWGRQRSVPVSGATTETRWPTAEEVRLNEGCVGEERERESREAFYQVTFSDKDHSYTHRPSTVDEFGRYKLGTRFHLKTTLAGSVEVVGPEGTK
jgi:hypothetical protein